MAAQTNGTLAKIDALLEAAGTDKTRLLTAQIWLSNITADFAAMNAVWSAWVASDAKPTRVCVQAHTACILSWLHHT